MDYFIPFNRGGGVIVDWDFQSIIHCFTWHNSNGYAKTLTERPNRKTIIMHRLLLNFPEDEVDHINGIRNDNRLINLRKATSQENAMNRKCHRDGISRQLYYDKQLQKWRLYTFRNGKSTYVGIFNSKKEGAKKYSEMVENGQRNRKS